MNFPPPSAKQARILWASLTALAVAILIGLLGVLCWALGFILQQLSTVILPLAIAAIIACLLDPVVDYLEGKGVARARAIICVFAFAFVLVGGLIGSVVPQIIDETQQLTRQIPHYANRLQTRLQSWISRPPAPLQRILSWVNNSSQTNQTPAQTIETNVVTVSTNSPADATTPADTGKRWTQSLDPKTLQSVTAWLATALPKAGSWLLGQVTRVASWIGVLAGLLLIPVYAFYLLLEKRGIERNWTDYLPVKQSSAKDELVFVLSSVNDCLVSFFRGQVLVAICDGILYTIGFFSIGLPYAFLLGAMATVLTMIPFLGAIITCIAALIIASVQFGDWLHPLLVLAVFGVIQVLEGLVISPKIMGNRVGLHPLTIIVSVMVGTTLMGNILGGILAIPLTAALRALMFRYVWKRRHDPAVQHSDRSLLKPET